MAIQWYPGHMAKAKRHITEKLKLVDIIFELVDARIPYSSRNPMLDEILKNKPRLILMTKIDMADKEKTKEWQKYFESIGIKAIGINAMTKEGINKITKASKEILKEKIERDKRRGLKPRAIRAMIVGIPNVGKSTLINRLVGKKVARVGDRPGVTKAEQWVKISGELELLDTPGILWPKFDDQIIGFNLAATGAIKHEILPKDEVAIFILKFLNEQYPNKLKKRYDLEAFNDDNIVETYDTIGKKRGCIQSGGHVDYDKVSELIIKDVTMGHLGGLTFEMPNYE